MRILFALRHPSYLRNFLSVIDHLASAGHRMHFVFHGHGPLGEDSLFDEIQAKHKSVTGQYMDERFAKIPWVRFAQKVRYGCDYLRYLDKRYENAKSLRYRAHKRAPRVVRAIADRCLSKWDPALKLALWLGPVAEWSLPIHPLIDRLVAAFRPDIVLVTPVVGLGSNQIDWIKAARLRRIPSVLPVASWDNLTNKGRLRVLPNKILVWNEAQKQEAIELHSATPEDVVVCGAWTYDHWFSWKPSLTKEEFLKLVGLETDSRYLLYVGSSPFIARHETAFCRRLIDALRSNPETEDLGILIRPHPQNAEQWESMDLSGLPNVAVYPRQGANPISISLQNQYFDSIWHSEAVFGINTSAQIEGGCIGRPVFTVTDRTFKETQGGTLHFHHLTDVNGGLLHVAHDPDQHAQQLAKILSLPAEERAIKSRKFVEAFVRPHGLDRISTPAVMKALEEAARETARAPRLTRATGTALRFAIWSRFTSFTTEMKAIRHINSVHTPQGEE